MLHQTDNIAFNATKALDFPSWHQKSKRNISECQVIIRFKWEIAYLPRSFNVRLSFVSLTLFYINPPLINIFLLLGIVSGVVCIFGGGGGQRPSPSHFVYMFFTIISKSEDPYLECSVVLFLAWVFKEVGSNEVSQNKLSIEGQCVINGVECKLLCVFPGLLNLT